jgi:hypothetical protein
MEFDNLVTIMEKDVKWKIEWKKKWKHMRVKLVYYLPTIM